MAIQPLAIPTDESGFKVELAYLHRWSPGSPEASPLSFLARTGTERADDAAAAYRKRLPEYRAEFAGMLEGRRFEFVISPPSTRNDFEPYRAEIVARGIANTDLSEFISRSGSGTARRFSFDQMVDALQFSGAPRLDGGRSLLIVDDYFVTGRTAAALLSILRSHGFPTDGDVTVACPLWLSRGT